VSACEFGIALYGIGATIWAMLRFIGAIVLVCIGLSACFAYAPKLFGKAIR